MAFLLSLTCASFFKMQEWVSWRWVAHTSDLCLRTSRRQLGPSVSPFFFQPIWLGFSTLLVPWGSQMDCCQGRWAWPAGGGGGGGGGVTPLLPRAATSWLLDPWHITPSASCFLSATRAPLRLVFTQHTVTSLGSLMCFLTFMTHEVFPQ